MTEFENYSLVLGSLTLLVLWVQLFLIYRAYKADHERRKKQSTIEYLNEIRKLYRPVELKLIEKFGDKVINILISTNVQLIEATPHFVGQSQLPHVAGEA